MTVVKKYTIEQFMDAESIVGSSLSRSGKKVLYSSDKTGIYNAYSLPAGGGEPEQLTASTEDSIYIISYFPEDDRFLYRKDRGGNEIHHLYLCDRDGKKRDLTPDKKARAEFYCWSRDGEVFFYGSNKRDPRYMDVYEMEIETFKTRLVFQNDEGYEFGAVSPDTRYLALRKNESPNDSNLFIYDNKEKEMRLLTEHEGDIQYYPREFDLQSGALYYLTDEDEEFLYLKKTRLADGETETIHRENWDIENVIFSYNHNYLIYSINKDGRTELKIFSVQAGEFMDLPRLPGGVAVDISISRDEKTAAFLADRSSSPADLYTYQLEEQRLNKLTTAMNPDINPEHLVEAEVIRYKSFDGLEIPAIYYRPHLKKGEKAPSLVWVHGGPGGQSRANYRPIIQYLVNHGYAVLAVNNRGSSGYGKGFFQAADRKHGEIDLADCVQARAFLQGEEYLDRERIGIIGGSYGGYMVLAALAFEPEQFMIGIDIFGVSNWVRTLKEIPSWWEAMRNVLYEKIGNPFEDEEYLRSISPLFHAENIKKPLIVLQGANDPRVLKVESDEIVEKVRANGVPVEYIVFSDEGHGFSKKVNRIKGYRAVLKFADHYLKGE